MGKKKFWKRVPVILAMLAATAELLSLSGPAGAAMPASPLERWGVAAPVSERQAEERTAPKKAARTPDAGSEAGPEVVPQSLPAADDAPEAVERQPVEDTYFEDVVFLGDSRTEGFHLYSGLKTGTYLYAVGATVQSVFTKKTWDTPGGKVPLLDALDQLECGKIYLMLGVNELGWPGTKEFQDQYAKVIDRIREEHPDAEVVLQSILPVSAKQDAKGSYVNNERIAAFNEAIASLAEEKDCTFLNVAEAVTGEDGCLPADLNFDGVHLNPAGCKVWLEYLRTHSV